jgi:hypothetical protein
MSPQLKESNKSRSFEEAFVQVREKYNDLFKRLAET